MTTELRTGFYPFWFWNDALSADEIRWQINEMADKGLRGFFIHPRQGLGQPYLSESFFEMVDVAVAAAEERGLLVHLYDEYPYPSGVAGGEVVLGCPQYYATKLVHETRLLAGGDVRVSLPKGKILCCMAYPMVDGRPDWARGTDLRDHVGIVLPTESYVETGLTSYNRKRYFASDPTPVLEAALPAGEHKLYVSAQVVVDHFKYWDHYVDVLNPDAVRRFIELTHERYRARYGEKFGRSIISIFVDETAPSWSDRVPAAFQAEYGYDLCALLPALQDAGHPEHLKVSHDLYRLKYKLFCESFEKPVSEWCARHGLAYSGEKSSLRMSQLQYMGIPGGDPGHTKAGAQLDMLQASLRANAKATAAAAHFYEKSGALCECYHSMGWSATLQDAKLVAEALLLMGTKYLVPHGLFYSTHALKKHDAPPTFFFQMPYWPLFGALARRVEKIAECFEGTRIDAQILLIDPASGIPTGDDQRAYEAIQWLLMGAHLDFHIVDTDILESGRVAGGEVHVGGNVAKVVVVPPMPVIEDPLREWLEGFEAAGGTVIYCEAGPALDELRGELLTIVQPSLHVRQRGEEAESVLVAKRVAADCALWFVLNAGGEPIEAELRAEAPLREIPLDDELPTSLEERDGRYFRTIQPFESVMVQAGEPAAAPQLPRVTVPVHGPAKLGLRNRNLLRMYEWEMSLLDGDGRPGRSAMVPAVPLSNQLSKGGFRFAPAIREYFGHAPELSFPELRVRYTYRFESDYAGPVELVMEPGSIAGEWVVCVNQGRTIGPGDLAATSSHVRGSLGVDITAALERGENCLCVEVTSDRCDGGLLNPLYLAGDFGVMLAPARLTSRKDTGTFEEYESNLLPYYAGIMEYTTEFMLDGVPDGEETLVELDYGRPFHEATEVSINGSEYAPVLWEPRSVRLPTKYLRAGKNTLSTRVYTTLVRSFEGQWFDYERHEYQDIG